MQSMNLSYISSLLGMVAFALIIWRLVSTWGIISGLSRALALLLAGALIIGAVSGFLSASTGNKVDAVVILRLIHRALSIWVAIYWHKWVKRP